ncbi:mitochondrial uncoupling protein 4-like [Uloborus diversus]|uniref:mitochondrial uncoupling protein 4-like n=1 Tax=Uloborus diversus TaxID=327109 RepID=UPI0024094D0E|nr:mitochondrial uncoupling protein 4-like [Uloborus diversus]XP_054707820.1 mitochondrial uncoupling protein 4-like [Uloborus diversus]
MGFGYSNRNHEKSESFMFKYFLSSCAASVAETATYPLDITKTRLQIQGETTIGKSDGVHSRNNIKSRGMLHTAVGIVKDEGVFKLWQGITPAIYRHFVYSGCRMTFYEIFREKVLQRKPHESPSIWKSVLCGSASGGLGQFLASPADLVKVQMQMEGKRRLEGHPPRVQSAWHAFRKILAEGGIGGLWKGWVPNVQRAALVNMGDLTTYDNSKHFILTHSSLKDDWLTHMIASSCSGLVAATLGTPADVIKTRVMNQPTDSRGKGLFYKSSIDCLLKTVHQEGFMALYKGFVPIWTRMAPWSITFWVTYEELRRLCGVSSF